MEDCPYISSSPTPSTAVGAAVKTFSAGQEVAGVLPLDTECPGCAEYCVVPEYCLGMSHSFIPLQSQATLTLSVLKVCE